MKSMTRKTKLPSYVYLYFGCQSINLMAAVISVAVAATVGNSISSNSLYATVPYGMQFLFILIGTYPASMIMKKYGRTFGFILGAIFLFAAGIIGTLAVAEESFLYLIFAHAFIGLFAACANFYRYAVTDSLPQSLQSRALSLVVAGGLVAAILGPIISIQLKDVSGFPQFSLCYAALAVLALINLGIIYFLPKQNAPLDETPLAKAANQKADRPSAAKNNIALVAICVAAFGYGVMNLIMIQSSLKMDYLHIPFEHAAYSIQWHLIAMFLPSLFTGVLIARIGHISISLMGFMFFLISFLINTQTASHVSIALSLILLGIGWNFTFVGGSALLAFSLTGDPNKQKWQGIGDTTIAVFATIGAVSPSFLLNGIGWANSNIVALISCMIPLSGLLYLKIKSGGVEIRGAGERPGAWIK